MSQIIYTDKSDIHTILSRWLKRRWACPSGHFLYGTKSLAFTETYEIQPSGACKVTHPSESRSKTGEFNMLAHDKDQDLRASNRAHPSES
jgi:hypothetical protein